MCNIIPWRRGHHPGSLKNKCSLLASFGIKMLPQGGGGSGGEAAAPLPLRGATEGRARFDAQKTPKEFKKSSLGGPRVAGEFFSTSSGPFRHQAGPPPRSWGAAGGTRHAAPLPQDLFCFFDLLEVLLFLFYFLIVLICLVFFF